ncbi:MAG: hypothetical protein M5R41_08560 [Bacteroidia bacterium]|nr:hypothetical protein [Bacteroidia bacterium]
MQSFASAMTRGLRTVFGALSGSEAVVSVPEFGDLPCDTLVLRRALFLNCSWLRPLSGIFGSEARAPGGRTRLPLIWSVGPGRIFLRDSAES